MSTIKTDAIISVSVNGNLDLSANGTGGVKVSDYLVQTKGADIASATSLTLGKDGNFFDVTGTTTITSIGTQGIGSLITLQFDGVLTFTHHATDLILPGATNITTAAGDIATLYEYASGDWRCVSYTKANGASIVDAVKGSDIASATTLTLGTDGNLFDVTGTTTITSIGTQGIGSYVTLHFDGALTFTHHATDLILPGAANITTAAGDIAVMYEYASGDWRCVSYTKASGEAVVAAGGGLVFIEKITASAATWDFEANLSSTYDTYMLAFRVAPATGGTTLQMTVSVAGTYASANYEWQSHHHDTTAVTGLGSHSDTTMDISADRGIGNQATQGCSGILWFHEPSSTSNHFQMHGTGSVKETDTNQYSVNFGGSYEGSTAAIDGVRLAFSSGNISGEASLYGLVRS